MKHKGFVHLHNHTSYSLLDGASRIDDLIVTAKKMNMPALAITDHGNMFGAIEFYQKAMKAGIKPILGSEVYVASGDRRDRLSAKSIADASFHLILLIKDKQGYENLMQLSSLGYLEGFYYRPRVDKDLLSTYHEGLIALSGCAKGEVAHAILDGRLDTAKEIASFYDDLFGEGNFYLEIQNHGLEEEATVRHGMVDISSDLGIPLVATNDCHYFHKKDAKAHDILLCLQTGKDRDDPQRLRFSTDETYFKSPQEMIDLFAETPEAIENTLGIADRCNLLLDFGKSHLPHFAVPKGFDSLDGYLKTQARQGLASRYPKVTPGMEERLEYEVQSIARMGYSGYFLIVKDFIDYARKEGIAVGPGRGSAAGSLVSYALGITDVDPIKYGLIFERFLNPERVTLPDIDIDFSDWGRDKIIEYVKKKYGQDNVTQIITFGTMAARAAIRDVGRVLKLTFGEADRLAKLVPFEPGMTLEKALNTVHELRQLVESDERYQDLMELAQTLEGITRHASTHAAGVVITPQKLTKYVPLFKSTKGEVTTQYDMKSVEEIGLLKMDFLGLRTLSVIQEATEMIAESRGVVLDWRHIPLDDKRTFALLTRADTVGVFQFESTGMRDYLRKLKPESLEDMIAMNALYRPGPLSGDMIDDFIHRKHGLKPIRFEHPLLEPILKETYGVIVYQEQVMHIASQLAGFSLGKADLLRRAMGKKQADVMAEQREEFVNGAMRNEIKESVANKIFDLIAHFAGYGFNKSHSAAYAHIAYQTAFLKAHYPLEFMAATMSSEMENTDRIVVLRDECKRMGIEVFPPDVNESQARFRVTDTGLRFGLGAIKNVGLGAIDSIVKARQDRGHFSSLYDFCQRVDLRLVNKRVIESLIQAGAMDTLEGNRAQQMAVVEQAVEAAQSYQNDRLRGQTSFFDTAGSDSDFESAFQSLPDIPEWPASEALAKEKAVLGFYVTGHPLAKYEEEISSFSTHSVSTLETARDGQGVTLGGSFLNVKQITDRKGHPMAFATLEDFTGTVEFLIFSDLYERSRRFVANGSMVLIRGKVSSKEDEIKIIAQEITPLSDVRREVPATVHILLSTVGLEQKAIERLAHILESNQGQCAVCLHLNTLHDGQVVVRSKRFKVTPSTEAVDQVKSIVGEEGVWLDQRPDYDQEAETPF